MYICQPIRSLLIAVIGIEGFEFSHNILYIVISILSYFEHPGAITVNLVAVGSPFARQENVFLTTATTQLGRGLTSDGFAEIQGWRKSTGLWGRTDIQWKSRWTEWWGVYVWDTPGQIDDLIIIQSMRTLCFPECGHGSSSQDFVDRHGRVVSYLLTHFLHSLSQNCSSSGIPCWCGERCGRVLMRGSLSSCSVVSQQ